MAIRRAAKIDDNQNELVALIRAMGVSVAITSAAHDGFTDLVVGFGDNRIGRGKGRKQRTCKAQADAAAGDLSRIIQGRYHGNRE